MHAGMPHIENARQNRIRDKMNSSKTLAFYLLSVLFIWPGAMRSWSAGTADNGFLRKKDFRISFDTAYTLKSAGKLSPVEMDFDFSALGDTGAERKATGRVFRTAWKAMCTDDRSNCDFFLTVLRQAKDSASLSANGSKLHTRVYDAGSKAAIEIVTRIIQDENISKLESNVSVAVGDSIVGRDTIRKAGNFSFPKTKQGHELKLSINKALGKQKLSLYTKEIDGAFKLAQIKVNLPAGFSADSSLCLSRTRP